MELTRHFVHIDKNLKIYGRQKYVHTGFALSAQTDEKSKITLVRFCHGGLETRQLLRVQFIGKAMSQLLCYLIMRYFFPSGQNRQKTCFFGMGNMFEIEQHVIQL